METAVERLQKVWPEWNIVRQIGRGGYGAVYEAVRADSKLNSRAAIKVISISQDSPEISSLISEGFTVDMTRTYMKNIVDGFINEIQMMEIFKGTQNIVNVEDYIVVECKNQLGWDVYIRMELLTPLTKYLQQHHMNENEVVKLGVDICKALELCATRNVIHRDIKPENIFVNDYGNFKLGDFGIARRLEGMTVNLSRKGTYSYVAPEVEHGEQYDARADIYSLGLVLYRLLNRNMMPFLTTKQQITDPIERIQATERRLSGEKLPNPMDASPDLAKVICRACAYEPEDRFSSASIMKEALLAASNKLVIGRKSILIESDTLKSKKKTNKHAWRIAALTMSLAVVMIGALIVLALTVGRNSISTSLISSNSSAEGVSAESTENGELESDSEESSGNAHIENTYAPDGALLVNEYDDSGKLVKSTEYPEDERHQYYITTFEYDDRGKRVKSKLNGYSSEGNILYALETEYEYGSNDKIVRSTTVTGEGDEALTQVSEYDSDEKVIEYTAYLADGKVYSITTNKYDDSEQLIGFETIQYSDGETYKTITEIDAFGNAVNYSTYDESGNLITMNTNEYDESGKIQSTVTTHRYSGDAGRTFKYTTMTIQYNYDAQGNLIGTTSYDEDGNVYELVYDEATGEFTPAQN